MYDIQKNDKEERVLIVGLDTDRETDIDITSSMKELKELVFAAGGVVISDVIQNKDRVDSTYYIGKGKAQEVALYCDELDIDTVVFNNELTGAQIRNLEEVLNRKIIDRTNLILDIFAKRATSKEGKLQVELAQLKYRLPRLIGLGNQLSRTGGGIGTRGPGEQKLETDRRHISRRINDIEKELKEIENVRMVKRKRRQNSEIPIVALVGYTNAGKSTLLNSLIKLDEEYCKDKEVFVQDMLFATLDTTLRKSVLPNGQGFLVTDTVGFVSKLPTKLIEAFKGTLEEVKYSDLLLHVVDMTNEDIDIQVKTTLSILKDLDVLDKPMITVFNKVDIAEKELIIDVKGPTVSISAQTGYNMDILLQMIQDNLPQSFYKVDLLIPYNESSLSTYLFDSTKVENFEYKEEGTLFTTTLDSIEYERFKRFIQA
ncbi:GTP-binding protein HflX [Proteiniborus ethanoligenes]|uniref:GTPase HflX n=1 Tax=Proteiniborus ethanoligenes TaxID=415015 RepID=A0A1H3QRH4_9FIRM|nr:GTPase HflX [Proteiniborus ethanoligenes]TAH61127.1 MAG: GTPase HflX [Gottschalkiaceae bacterium]SDZ15608.1 GTP-binding protein HflX [Proteiniborus ethanoligenes]